MKTQFNRIFSICKKDLHGLAPLVLLVIGFLIMETLITKLDLDLQGQLWNLLVLAAPDLSAAAVGLLIIAVFQLDTPSSLSHDWLIRPIPKHELFIAKFLFLLLVTALPLILIRFLVNIGIGYSMLESIIEASAFKNPYPMVAIPAFICIGIISRTVLQALGILVGLLLLIAVTSLIPVLTVPHPDKINFNGFDWLPIYFALILVVVCLCFVAWFQYYRRDAFRARACIAITLLLGAFSLFASFQLPLWPSLYSTLSKITNDIDSETAASITLDSLYGCYPAVTVGTDLYGDAETPQEGMKGLAGLNYFTAWELEAAGPNGIAFSTRVQARNLPSDWRLATVNATATFTSMKMDNSFRLSPAAGATPARVNARSDGTHFWALPEQQVEIFAADPSTRLTVDLDVAVLAPTEYLLEPDGKRRHFPGLGYCSAEIDSIKNELQVECFKRGPRPTMVSAEIEGIPSSRVDATRPNFSPKFLQFFGGKHFRMNIASASLLRNPEVKITLFEQKAFLSKQLTTPGLLGAATETCPLPSDDYQGDSLLSSWSDRSPHQSSLINVDRNVRLEVLEWAYDGATKSEESSSSQEIQDLVLLAGGGATAHSYDDIAPRLAKQFRVIALTRRGFGASSKPSSGYDIPRLTEDVIQVMDSLNISDAIFVGHSLAGDELSALGADYPERVSGLVYLDAAYNRENMMFDDNGTSLNGIQPPVPRPFPQELQSYSGMQRYFDRIGSVGSPEGSIMSSYDFTSGTRTVDQKFGQATLAQLDAPRYGLISAPAVAIYAIGEITKVIRPWFDHKDELLMRKAEESYYLRQQFQAEQIAAFENSMPHAEVIEIEGGDHSIHISHEDEVIAAILELAGSLRQ